MSGIDMITEATAKTVRINGFEVMVTGIPESVNGACDYFEYCHLDRKRNDWLEAHGATTEPVGSRYKCSGPGFNEVGDTLRDSVDAAMDSL